MNPSELKIWITEIKKGNRLAYSNFFRESYGTYVAYAQRYVYSKDASSDIVQDAFIKLWEVREQLEAHKSLKAFMYTIVRNLALNYIRDHESRYTELDEENLSNHQEEKKDSGEDSSSESLFQVLISRLPERQKEAFELSRFDGLQHDEIAQIMNVSPRTVNNHIVAALKTLRDEYEKETSKVMAL